jgi:hypothetical protein
MTVLRGAAGLALLAACLLLVSACSISINTSSTPTPSPTPQPTSTAKPVSVVISAQLDSGRCETSSNITVFVEGHNVGTMSVVNQLIQTDRLTVMLPPGLYAYTLKGTAFLQSNGQAFNLTASGKGQVQVNAGPNNWALQVDSTRIPPGVCPTSGTTWAVVLES